MQRQDDQLLLSQVKENTSRKWSSILGYVFVTLIFSSFAYLYAIETYITDFFQISFFQDSMRVGQQCEMQNIENAPPNTPLDFFNVGSSKVELPHNYKIFSYDGAADLYRHVRYACRIDASPLASADGVVLLHLGWVYGQRARVYLNNQLKLEFSGPDKALIALNADDFKADLSLEVIAEAPMNSFVGIVGKTPLVISAGFKTNSKVMGLEMALQTIRYLFSLLPMLTLGLFFSFGWLAGVRSRLILATFFYFSFILFRNIIPVSFNYLPIQNVDKMYDIQRIFEFNSLLALLIFGLELLGLLGPYIRYFMASVVFVSVVELVSVFNENLVTIFVKSLSNYHSFAYVILSTLLIFAGVKKNVAVVEKGRRKINYLFLSVLGLSCVLVIMENLLSGLGIGVVLNRKLDVLMPLFTSGIVIYTITLIEKAYQAEKQRRTKMEADLAIAKEIQDSLAPPPPETKFGNMTLSCHQIKHSQVAGDWMAVRKDPDQLVMVLVDVTGKGVQAGLVGHAIQSLWAEALVNETLDVENWVQKVNRTLHVLGQRMPHSATAGILVAREGEITYRSYGHLPVYVVVNHAGEPDRVEVLKARGSILGISESVQCEPSRLRTELDAKFDLYLGSDGVFQKGTRTKPRDVLALHEQLKKDVTVALDLCDVNDDRSLIHLQVAKS